MNLQMVETFCAHHVHFINTLGVFGTWVAICISLYFGYTAYVDRKPQLRVFLDAVFHTSYNSCPKDLVLKIKNIGKTEAFVRDEVWVELGFFLCTSSVFLHAPDSSVFPALSPNDLLVIYHQKHVVPFSREAFYRVHYRSIQTEGLFSKKSIAEALVTVWPHEAKWKKILLRILIKLNRLPLYGKLKTKREDLFSLSFSKECKKELLKKLKTLT